MMIYEIIQCDVLCYGFNCRTFKTPLETTEIVCEHVVEWYRLHFTTERCRFDSLSQTTFFLAFLSLLGTPF